MRGNVEINRKLTKRLEEYLHFKATQEPLFIYKEYVCYKEEEYQKERDSYSVKYHLFNRGCQGWIGTYKRIGEMVADIVWIEGDRTYWLAQKQARWEEVLSRYTNLLKD